MTIAFPIYLQFSNFKCSNLSHPSALEVDAKEAIVVQQAMDEAELFLMTCAVPIAYLLGLACACCCGDTDETDVEMSKMDKIYDEVRR
jgi:hypothetical protein